MSQCRGPGPDQLAGRPPFQLIEERQRLVEVDGRPKILGFVTTRINA
jgi:hypothetical protein